MSEFHCGRFARTVIVAGLMGSALAHTSITYAQDLRNKVFPAAASTAVSPVIDLQKKTIFGTPLGTTEDQFIARHGPAIGYVRLSPGKSLMVYGNTVGFLFDGGKLAGVRLSSMLMDWRVAQELSLRTPFQDMEWQLGNGLREDMLMDEVKRILGKQLQTGRYNSLYYVDNGLRVDFDIATSQRMLNGVAQDGEQRLSGIFIH